MVSRALGTGFFLPEKQCIAANPHKKASCMWQLAGECVLKFECLFHVKLFNIEHGGVGGHIVDDGFQIIHG